MDVYADDLILLSLSVAGLQDMLNIRQDTATSLALCLNANVCHLISFGTVLQDMGLSMLAPVPQTGVLVLNTWVFALSPVNICHLMSARLSMHLTRLVILSYRIKWMTSSVYRVKKLTVYSSSGCMFSRRQWSELNACWNNAYRPIFKFNQ
jgi:hypothetical protein